MPDYADSIDALQQVTQSSAFEGLAPPLQMAVFLGSLAFITTLLVSVTSFTRIVIVLSFVRRAMTTQEIPPNASLMGLALFLTVFTMGPTIDAIFEKAGGAPTRTNRSAERPRLSIAARSCTNS